MRQKYVSKPFRNKSEARELQGTWFAKNTNLSILSSSIILSLPPTPRKISVTDGNLGRVANEINAVDLMDGKGLIWSEPPPDTVLIGVFIIPKSAERVKWAGASDIRVGACEDVRGATRPSVSNTWEYIEPETR